MELDLDHGSAEAAKYAGLGFLGGIFSGAPSWKTLKGWQLVGCGATGLFVAYLGTPLIPALAWKDAPHELLYAVAGFLGIGSATILAIATAWWKMVERRDYFSKMMRQKLGTPSDDPPTPFPPTK